MAAGLYDITNEILGKGHFAIVKLARHCLTGEHVAIKIVDKMKLTKEGLEQLSCEIKLWSILSRHEHPNVVKLYQCIDTRTKLYLVMEYCGNDVCDLYDHIQKKNDGNGLDEDEAKHIFRQICKAIYYCHSLKIVHRDLKPENILIINSNNNNTSSCRQGKNSCDDISITVKLIDFGFSNQWCEDELLRTSCGSLAYSAPEILLGNQYDGPKVDIWALGCILYILLYGHNPFMQFNDNETLIKILDCSFTTPAKPSISDLAIELIRSLLKKDPNMRLTIEEVINHQWLKDKNSNSGRLSSDFTHRRESRFKNLVHEHIIDQMINRGISVSKDTIKKILKNEQIDSTNEQKTDGQTTTNNTSQNDPVQNHKSSSPTAEINVNDHHYIKATYHLLKDKSNREFTGVPDPNQQIIKLRQNKRGNIITQTNRRRMENFNSNQIENSNNLVENERKFPLSKKIMELDVDLSSNHKNSLTSPSSSSTASSSSPYVLPLARKCSIVSEEGSICAETVNSNHNCFQEIDNEEEKISNDLKNNLNKPSIDIFVTDSSSNISTKINGDDDDEQINNDNDNDLLKKDHHPSPPGILHPVSSSPDFTKMEHYNDDNDDTGIIIRPNDIVGVDGGDHEKKLTNVRCNNNNNTNAKFNIISQINQRKQSKKLFNLNHRKSNDDNNETLNNDDDDNKPSMRVLVQSKSLNNLAFIGQRHQNHNNRINLHNTSATSSSSKKMTNSLSTMNIKNHAVHHHSNHHNDGNNQEHKGEKNDCCSIN